MEDQDQHGLHADPQGDKNLDEVSLQVEEGPQLSAADRLLAVVTSPRRAFQGLTRAKVGGTVVLALVVAIVLGVLSVVTTFSSQEIFEKTMEQQIAPMEEMLEDETISESRRENIRTMIEQQTSMGRSDFMAFSGVGVALGIPIVALLDAILILILAKIFESGRETRIKYSHSVAVASLAAVVWAIGGFVMALFARMTGSLAFTQGLAAAYDGSSQVLKSVLIVGSVPTIWFIVVAAIGISEMARTTLAKPFVALLATVIFLFALLGAAGGFLSQMGMGG